MKHTSKINDRWSWTFVRQRRSVRGFMNPYNWVGEGWWISWGFQLFFAEGQGYLVSYYRNCLQMGFELPPDTAIFIEYIYISIWANYNNSHTWNKAILGWFPLLTMIPGLGRSEVVIIHPDIYIYIYIRTAMALAMGQNSRFVHENSWLLWDVHLRIRMES